MSPRPVNDWPPRAEPVVKDWGGRLPVALVYPNSYYLGMSPTWACKTIYGLLNRRADIVCERAFYDPPHKSERGDDPSLGPVTIESQRPLADFPGRGVHPDV